MTVPEFPLYITEINCEIIGAFRFSLPNQEMGWDGLILYVEYGEAADSMNHTTYHVWAQYKEAVFRAFLYTGSIPCASDENTIIAKIVSDINSSAQFHEKIFKLVCCMED